MYRKRNEVQENSFKNMIDHGALDTNYGRKKIIGPDRHQQRAKEKLEEKLEEAQQKVEKKENLVRTLLLENVLISFIAALCGNLKEKVSLESILRILFERSGSRVETPSDVIYWVNTEGLSVPYRRMLAEVLKGLCAMDLKWRGKPVRVRLKEAPT